MVDFIIEMTGKKPIQAKIDRYLERMDYIQIKDLFQSEMDTLTVRTLLLEVFLREKPSIPDYLSYSGQLHKLKLGIDHSSLLEWIVKNRTPWIYVLLASNEGRKADIFLVTKENKVKAYLFCELFTYCQDDFVIFLKQKKVSSGAITNYWKERMKDAGFEPVAKTAVPSRKNSMFIFADQIMKGLEKDIFRSVGDFRIITEEDASAIATRWLEDELCRDAINLR